MNEMKCEMSEKMYKGGIFFGGEIVICTKMGAKGCEKVGHSLDF